MRVARNVESGARTFQFVAERWLAQGEKQGFQRRGKDGARPWSAHHVERNTGLVRRFLLPTLGNTPITDVTEAMVEAPIVGAYEAGTRESARRAAVIARQIMGYAKARRWIATNPLADILSHPDIPKPEVKHFKAINPEQVGPMLRALGASGTELTTRAALMLFTGLRDASLRAARWEDIDLGTGTWTIPAARMKSRRAHTVPLPVQAVGILKALAKVTDKGPQAFVFASHGKAGFLAENTLEVCAGPFSGTRLPKYYRAKHLVGKSGRGGKFRMAAGGDLYRMLARVQDVRTRPDRISLRPLRNMVFRIGCGRSTKTATNAHLPRAPDTR